MNPREYAKNFNLQPLIEATADGEPKEVVRENGRSLIEAEVGKVFGNNNVGFTLKDQPMVLIFSEHRENVLAATKSLKNPAWLAEVYKTETVTGERCTKYRENANSSLEKNYQKINDFKFAQMGSFTLVENIPGSIERRTEEVMDENTRLQFVSQTGRQLSTIISDINRSNCIWTDLKPGNLLLRDNGRIAVADMKGFVPYKQIIVSDEVKYTAIQVNNEDEFKNKEPKKNEFLLCVTQKGELQYRVMGPDGKTESGTIKDKELKETLSDKGYAEINAKMKEGAPIKSYLKSLVKIAAKHGHAEVNYFSIITDVTPNYRSNQSQDEGTRRFTSPDEVRKNSFESWKKEYSFQMALVLYYTAVGEKNYFQVSNGREFNEKTFNFNFPVFTTTEQGKKLAEVIRNLGRDDPLQRITCEQAGNELKEMGKSLGMTGESTAEIKRSTLMAKRKSLAFVAKRLQPEAQSNVENKRSSLMIKRKSLGIVPGKNKISPTQNEPKPSVQFDVGEKGKEKQRELQSRQHDRSRTEYHAPKDGFKRTLQRVLSSERDRSKIDKEQEKEESRETPKPGKP